MIIAKFVQSPSQNFHGKKYLQIPHLELGDEVHGVYAEDWLRIFELSWQSHPTGHDSDEFVLGGWIGRPRKCAAEICMKT